MNAHFASAGGFELDYAARIPDRHRCDEFHKSRLAASLAPTIAAHQEPFQLTGVQAQLLRGPVYALPASNVDRHRPQLLWDRGLPCARLSPLFKSRSDAVDATRFFHVCCHTLPCDSSSPDGLVHASL